MGGGGAHGVLTEEEIDTDAQRRDLRTQGGGGTYQSGRETSGEPTLHGL